MSLQKPTPRTMTTIEHMELVQKHTQAFYDVLAAAALDGVELQTVQLQEEPVVNNVHVLTHGVPVLKHTPLGLYSVAIKSIVTYKSNLEWGEAFGEKDFKKEITILIPGEHPDIDIVDDTRVSQRPIVEQSINFSPK